MVTGWWLGLVLGIGGFDSWVAPSKTTRISDNGRWTATVTPGACKACFPGHVGEHDGRHASVELLGPDGRPRTFELLHPSMPVQFAVLGGGDLICIDHWGQTGHGRCLARYRPDGELAWARTLGELLPAESLAVVPTSVSSKSWVRSPLKLEHDRDRGRIELSLWNSDRLRIDLGTGESTYEVVEEFGEDAHGWYRKALALAMSGELDRAVAFQHRAVDLDLALTTGYQPIANGFHRRGESARAVGMYRDALERTRDREWDVEAQGVGDPRQVLRYQLAIAHLRGDQASEAETILRDLLKEDPSHGGAESTLVGLLFRAKRDGEAKALVDAAYGRVRGDPTPRATPEERHANAVMHAAYLCQQGKRPRLAAEWFRRGLREGAWSEMMGMSFITLLDQQLEAPGEAADVMERILEDLRASRKLETDPEHRRWWDERIQSFEQRHRRLVEKSRI